MSKSDPVYNYIKSLGFADNEIKERGNEYVVEGDILFSKDMTIDTSISKASPKIKQYGASSYVKYDLQPSVTVRIDPSMNAHSNEINAAINMWNNVPNCRLRFTLTNATSQLILITSGSSFCGEAYYPSNGVPGSIIRININNINQYGNNSFDQRVRTIAHELGHSIGFVHTNETGPMQILGTPTGADNNSLMNGGQCGSGSTTLSNFDIIALQFLYPANPPVTGTVPVLDTITTETRRLTIFSRQILSKGIKRPQIMVMFSKE